MRVSTIVVAVLAAATCLNAVADETVKDNAPATRDDVRKLLEVTHADTLAKQMIAIVMGQFKKNVPGVPDELWEEMSTDVSIDELLNLQMDLYIKYYSAAEIRELVEFYRSPIGQKLLEKQPKIMSESMAAGAEWGKRASERVRSRLRAKGYKIPPTA